MPEPKADPEGKDNEKEDPKEVPVDIEGDVVDHDDEADKVGARQIEDAMMDVQPEEGDPLLVPEDPIPDEQLGKDTYDDDEPSPDGVNAGMQDDDGDLPPEELEEDFVKDTDKEKIQHDELLLQVEDNDNDDKAEVVLFEGLVEDFAEQAKAIPPNEVVLPANEVLPASPIDKKP